MMMISCQ